MRFSLLTTSALLAATTVLTAPAPMSPAEWQAQQAQIQQQNIDKQNALVAEQERLNAAQTKANNGGAPPPSPPPTTPPTTDASPATSGGGKSGSIQASKYNDDPAQCASLLIHSGACAGLGTAGATNPVALGAVVFDAMGKAAVCGKTIRLTNPANGKTTTATVTDRAGADIVDMCNANWAALGGDVANDADFPITYSF